MINVREIMPDDINDLVHLMGDLGYASTEDDMRLRLAEMSPSHYHTLVAEFSGKVVGFIGLLTLPVYEHSKPIGWILALSVSSKHRRQGIGRALLGAAENFYRQHDVSDVRLHSGLQRAEAHDFYEALGYEKTGLRFKKHIEEA